MKTMSRPFLVAALFAVFFSVTSCEKEETGPPDSMRINKIYITEYPITNGGVPWDDPFIGSATPPDISWTITGPQSFNANSMLQDADGVSIEFTNGLPIFLTELESTYAFRVWDIDDLDGSDLGSNDDEIGAIGFIPWANDGDEDRTTIYLEGDGCSVQMEVSYLRE